MVTVRRRHGDGFNGIGNGFFNYDGFNHHGPLFRFNGNNDGLNGDGFSYNLIQLRPFQRRRFQQQRFLRRPFRSERFKLLTPLRDNGSSFHARGFNGYGFINHNCINDDGFITGVTVSQATV